VGWPIPARRNSGIALFEALFVSSLSLLTPKSRRALEIIEAADAEPAVAAGRKQMPCIAGCVGSADLDPAWPTGLLARRFTFAFATTLAHSGKQEIGRAYGPEKKCVTDPIACAKGFGSSTSSFGMFRTFSNRISQTLGRPHSPMVWIWTWKIGQSRSWQIRSLRAPLRSGGSRFPRRNSDAPSG
jgi:hypothetical protein